ncbi:MAG: four helix bundle protein [bacterium]|nr:four helix bundle protein [bacterium]
MIKPSRKPYGYRDLLVYKKAEHLQLCCTELTHQFPRMKTLIAFADQMDRSARSTKQNIVEGWKRNSTNEYYEFLGFSIGANTELEEDCDDICKGVYPELMGVKGVMGEMGEKGIMRDIENLKFYPIDPSLPPVVQLKLQCKELNFLFDKLQKSLLNKMENEHSLSSHDKFQLHEQQTKKEQDAEEAILIQYGLKRLENGRVVKDE